MANVFATAQAVPSKETKGTKSKKQQVHIDNLAMYAKLDAAEKAIVALKETYRVSINDQVTDQFVLTGKQVKRRPDNFRGVDDGAEASCELRKRSSLSGLSETEVDLLVKFGVSTTENVTRDETFIINPELVGDAALMERVGTYLGKLKDVPSNFFLKQGAVKKTVVAEESLDEVFKLPEAAVRLLLPVVGVLAVKPVAGQFDAAAALAEIAAVLNDVEESD